MYASNSTQNSYFHMQIWIEINNTEASAGYILQFLNLYKEKGLTNSETYMYVLELYKKFTTMSKLITVKNGYNEAPRMGDFASI